MTHGDIHSGISNEAIGDTDLSPDTSARLPFEVIAVDDGSISFAPAYYPDRLNWGRENELSRDPNPCGGEDVEIEHQKNTEFHAKGIVLGNQVRNLTEIINHNGELDLITPIYPRGGMEVVVKSGELGDLKGWDPLLLNWQYEYTLDLVSTGRDELGSQESQIVTDALNTLETQENKLLGGRFGIR